MKETEIALLVDNPDGKNIFDLYAREIEQSSMEGDLNPYMEVLRMKFEEIERQLQDLSEKIDASNENELNIYGLTIEKSRRLLNNWLGLFQERNKYPNVQLALMQELDRLSNYIKISNIESKSIDQIKTDFETNFTLEVGILENFARSVGYEKALKANDYNSIASLNSFILGKLYGHLSQKIAGFFPMEQGEIFSQSKTSSKESNKTSNEYVIDGENIMYIWNVHVWVNNKDAIKVNKFLNTLSSTLGYIEGVEIEIIDTGIGSVFQKWRMKFKGWLAKDETKQVMSKSAKAAESYLIERHIEPIAKSKTERKKIEEETNRMMSIEQSKEMNELLIQEKKEDVKAKRLSNMKEELEIRGRLSEIMSQGFIEIDSDFKVMINDLMFVSKEQNRIQLGDIDKIDEKSDREKIDIETTDGSSESDQVS